MRASLPTVGDAAALDRILPDHIRHVDGAKIPRAGPTGQVGLGAISTVQVLYELTPSRPIGGR
jgi:hypothetical protein